MMISVTTIMTVMRECGYNLSQKGRFKPNLKSKKSPSFTWTENWVQRRKGDLIDKCSALYSIFKDSRNQIKLALGMQSCLLGWSDVIMHPIRLIGCRVASEDLVTIVSNGGGVCLDPQSKSCNSAIVRCSNYIKIKC